MSGFALFSATVSWCVEYCVDTKPAADVHEAIQHVRWICSHRELLRGEGALKWSCDLGECVPVAESVEGTLRAGHVISRGIYLQAVHGMFDSMWEQRNKGVRISEQGMLYVRGMLQALPTPSWNCILSALLTFLPLKCF